MKIKFMFREMGSMGKLIMEPVHQLTPRELFIIRNRFESRDNFEIEFPEIPVKQMTLRQVEDAAGHDVEIVKESCSYGYKYRKDADEYEGWYFKLIYRDNTGYKITIEGTGFKDKQTAIKQAKIKREQIEKGIE